MRKFPIRFVVVLITFAVGVVVTGFWFAYRIPVVETLPIPLCAGPPQYDTPTGPCSGTDFAALSNLPVIAYCDLIRGSPHRDNQVVRVRGIYSFNQENSAMDDSTCRSEHAWTWVRAETYSNFMENTAMLKRNQPAEVVFLGKFSGPNKEGYGHLNGYRYEVMVMKVEELKPLALGR